MADSKFLKWQDKNGDYIIDKCDDQLANVEEPPQECDPCRPDNCATVPNWRTLDSGGAFFNGKICRYQVTIETSLTTTGFTPGTTEEDAIESLKNIFDAYSEQAAEALLIAFNKDLSIEYVESVKSQLQYSKYYLSPRAKSRLKILFSVSISAINSVPDDTDPGTETETDPDDSPVGSDIVTYFPDDLKLEMLVVRKTLNLYERYRLAFIAVDGGNLIFQKSRKPFSLKEYGDSGRIGGSLLSTIIPSLDSFFNSKGYNLRGSGGIFSGVGKKNIDKFTVHFSDRYKITQIDLYIDGCNDIQKSFKSKKLKSLNVNPAFKDPTAMKYFASISSMASDAKARKPKNWLKYVIEYTYPPIFETFNYPPKKIEDTSSSIIVDRLKEEGKQLGQDIISPVFGIGDAIAYKFNKNLCELTPEQVQKNKIKLGLIYDPEEKVDKTIFAVAQEQAFKTLEDQDAVFTNLCKRVLNLQNLQGNSAPPSGSADKPAAEPDGAKDTYNDGDEAPSSKESEAGVDSKTATSKTAKKKIFRDFIHKIKVCGLSDMMLEVMRCLMKGLSLEESLSKIILASMRAMSLENFEKFFILLPDDKKEELDKLVMKKLKSGDIFTAGSKGQELTDKIASSSESSPYGSDPESEADGTTAAQDQKLWTAETDPDLARYGPNPLEIEKPWTNPDELEKEKMHQYQGTFADPKDSRTLAEKYDLLRRGNDTFDKNKIMEAYFLAIVEVYGDDLLNIVDILDKFPGAQTVAKVLSVMDCPRPIILEPNVMEFLADLELPFCRSNKDITLPKLKNPFAQLPKRKDITAALLEAAKWAIQQAIVMIVMKILVKVCNLMGSSLCQAIDTFVDAAMAAAFPSTQDRNQLSEIIRNSIAGSDSDPDDVETTVNKLFELLGTGASEFSDQETLVEFVGDISAAATRKELMDAMLGTPNEDFINIVDSLITHDYALYREAMPTKNSIKDFFMNIGNLMPLPARDSMRDFVESLPEQDNMPASPSLCASDELIEEHCDLRQELLAGRCSPEQSKQMCEDIRDELKDDLEDLSCTMQSGFSNTLNNSMPQLVSDPGCNNGLLPYEPAAIAMSATEALKTNLKFLKLSYSTDMLGNGGLLLGRNGWGFINMIMSDTMGNPLTVHNRKSFLRKNYVDFYLDQGLTGEDEDYGRYGSIRKQEGAYPYKIAEWLQKQMIGDEVDLYTNLKYSSTNDYVETYSVTVPMDKVINIDYTEMPDLGHNIYFQLDAINDQVKIVESARKLTPDVTYQFRDNNRGMRELNDSAYLYGFDIELYFSDVYENINNDHLNLYRDNVRFRIIEYNNPSAKGYEPTSEFEDDDVDPRGSDSDTTGVLSELKFEFRSDTSILQEIDDKLAPAVKDLDESLKSRYPVFASAFTSRQIYSPQVLLLSEILKETNSGIQTIETKTLFDKFLTNFIKDTFLIIGENEKAFNYGAVFDDLTTSDLDYLVPEGYSQYGSLYGEGQIADSEGNMIPFTNRNMILGISRMQYEMEAAGTPELNRVFYLDPAQHGGTYMNPGIYIKPLKNEGWLGFIDVMFPDLNPCKPNLTDLVDFADIEETMEKKYPSTPEDDRINSEKECAVELPYNRILSRYDKVGLEGLINAAIRIFCSVHIIKSMATFTRFKPDFKNVFGPAYASYIVEAMEKSYKEAQPDFPERFNHFKDYEFWYAFLEQSVQLYARRVDDDEIIPPLSVIVSLNALNDYQEAYSYPDRDDLLSEKIAGTEKRFKTLKNFRLEKNLQGVAETENAAKNILKEIVLEQLNYMSDKFSESLSLVDMGPSSDEPFVLDMAYHILERYTQGSSLDLNKKIIEETVDLPIEGEEHYTGGGEFVVSENKSDDISIYKEGDEYIGYYHVHEAPDGSITYMAGEFHVSADHDVLKPFGTKIVVPIGDVEEYGFSPDESDTQPFVIEKYISINGERMAPSSAISLIKANDTSLNISDVYPGSLEIFEMAGHDAGLTGELGVRYGLQFSIYLQGTKNEISSVEIDSLDLKIGEVQPFDGDTKILLCLVNLLKADSKFRLCTEYIMPFKNILSSIAVYNDMAFMPSIGEITVGNGDSSGIASSIDSKPGMGVEFDSDGNIGLTGADGWASYKDRKKLFSGFGMFNKQWDDWDQILLRRSNKRIKRMFKSFYFRRDFKLGEFDLDLDPATAWMKYLRETLKPATGDRLLPRWQKFRLRSNPFNSQGKLCDD